MRLDSFKADPEHLQTIERLCSAVRTEGGRGFLVGGAVRDAHLDRRVIDFDIEVFGLSPQALQQALERHWKIDTVGASFAVFKLRHLPIDVSLPRRERKTGSRHGDFMVEADPEMPLGEATRRRDFTINSILFDPLDGDIEDPFEGRKDLEARVLRHTSERFGEDPLRVLRGMQLCARFVLEAAPETIEICRRMTTEGLARDRVFEEWRKLLLQGEDIESGLAFLRDTGWTDYFPELAALIDCPQDPQWHPEGDVWVHTLHVMNAFAKERLGKGEEREDLVVGLACLCHDLGKPATTREEGGRIRSRGHEAGGEGPTRTFLARLTQQSDLVEDVVPLVREHLKPRQLYEASAGESAVRRLANRVGRIDRLVRVAQADAAGRPPLPADGDPSAAWLLARAQELALADRRPRPLVMGRHLIERGMSPGPRFGPLLELCFEAQLDGAFHTLEEGLSYLESVLARRGGAKSEDRPTPPDDTEIKAALNSS